MREFEDPKLALSIIKEQDKGKFGVDDVVNRDYVNTMLTRAREAVNIFEAWNPSDEKGDTYISRGDLAKIVCEAFPFLNERKGGRMPFKQQKHQNAGYVETLARLGMLDVYKMERDFHYGRPVTKGELTDIIMRVCVAAAGA